jgi:hypothetical protein
MAFVTAGNDVAVDFDLDDMGAVRERHPLARQGVIGVERRALVGPLVATSSSAIDGP